MAITAAMVKELREISGAGMMDCKKALTATEGDMDKAMEFLREKGLATAQKKASRIAAEGIVMLKVAEDSKKAVAVEVNAETDFVAKNEKFQAYVAQVAEQALETEAADIDAFLAETWKFDTTKTVNEALAGQVAVIGENMKIRRFQKVEETDTGLFEAKTEENQKPVVAFEETGCVEGSWEKDDQENTNVKKGARYPDEWIDTKGMEANPWWHGFYKKKRGANQGLNNYIASYIFITRMANQIKDGGTASKPGGLSGVAHKSIVNDIARIEWEKIFKKKASPGQKRAFVWGMAIHSLTDMFSHTAYKNGEYMSHDSGQAHIRDKRFDLAIAAKDLAMRKYSSSQHYSGTVNEFSPIKQATSGYKFGNICKYVKEVTGDDALASSYKNYNKDLQTK